MSRGSTRQHGTVKFFNIERGYGFVSCEAGRDVFLHISDWVHEHDPHKGDAVNFIVDPRDVRPRARRIVVVKE
jgi:cold shock protein